jgi:sortase A
MILPEKYQEIDVRMDNARWILPSDDERLTLVTCWPATSNTHRLIIVARPLGDR